MLLVIITQLLVFVFSKNEVAYGEKVTSAEQFPFMAVLTNRNTFLSENKNYYHSPCIGALIQPNAILTSAHCIDVLTVGAVESGIPPEAKLGTSFFSDDSRGHTEDLNGDKDTSLTFEVERMVKHHGYVSWERWQNPLFWPPGHKDPDATGSIHDIGVIFIKEKAWGGNAIETIDITNENVKQGDELTIAGWGKTETPAWILSGHLHSFEIKAKIGEQDGASVTPSQNCKDHILGDGTDNTMFCIDEEDDNLPAKMACAGESGAPVFRKVNNKWTLYGIAALMGKKCGERVENEFHGNGVSNVYYYKQWIQDTLDGIPGEDDPGTKLNPYVIPAVAVIVLVVLLLVFCLLIGIGIFFLVRLLRKDKKETVQTIVEKVKVETKEGPGEKSGSELHSESVDSSSVSGSEVSMSSSEGATGSDSSVDVTPMKKKRLSKSKKYYVGSKMVDIDY